MSAITPMPMRIAWTMGAVSWEIAASTTRARPTAVSQIPARKRRTFAGTLVPSDDGSDLERTEDAVQRAVDEPRHGTAGSVEGTRLTAGSDRSERKAHVRLADGGGIRDRCQRTWRRSVGDGHLAACGGHVHREQLERQGRIDELGCVAPHLRAHVVA